MTQGKPRGGVKSTSLHNSGSAYCLGPTVFNMTDVPEVLGDIEKVSAFFVSQSVLRYELFRKYL